MQSDQRLATKAVPVFLCLLAMLMVACGSSNSTSTSTLAHIAAPANRQVLVSGDMYATPDIKTLDPALATDAFSNVAIQDIFTGLVQLDDELNVKPQLAQSYQVMPDGVTYKFTLRPDLKFSDGMPLTSQDVVYSINRALDPATKSPTGPYYLKYIKDSAQLGSKVKTLIGDSLLALDPNTVEIITDHKYAFFLDALTYSCSYVVEKSLIDKYGAKWTEHLNAGGGAGPFKVLQFTHSKELDLVPNTNYYGPMPKLQKLEYPIYQSGPTAYKAYQSNEVDNTYMPAEHFAQDKTRPDFYNLPALQINYYAMNYNKKPFDDIKIRQAFALAVNKDLIVNQIWKGRFIATNHVVPQGMPGYKPNLEGPTGEKGTAGDPTRAKQLLQQGMQEEGYTSVSQIPPITLTFTSGGDAATKDEVAALQQMWQTVLGIGVKISDIDFNTLVNDAALGANNPLQLYAGPAWIADYPDPQDWTTLQFGKGQAQNGMNYGQNNTAVAAAQQANQRAMEQADSMPNGPERLAAYNRIEQQLVDEVAWLPTEQATLAGLRKPCVQGIVVNSQGLLPPDDWSNVYISTDTPCVNATV